MILQFEQAIIKAFIVAFADVLPFRNWRFSCANEHLFYFNGNTFLCVAILLLYLFVQLTRQPSRFNALVQYASATHIPYILYQPPLFYYLAFMVYY